MLKFDTRDKKPKLWNLAGVTAATAVFFAVCLLTPVKEPPALAGAVLVLYFTTAFILLVSGFRKQIQYNPYSYNTIIYMGFALFDLSVIMTHTVLTVRMVLDPASYQEKEILYVLLNSARNYMFLSLPFILFFSAGLCISNLFLIRHEGRRFVNLLGIILSFLMIGGEEFLLRYDSYLAGSGDRYMLHALLSNLFAAVYLYFECMLVGAIVADVIAARYEPEPDRDFLIILGCGIRKDGSPSPLLRGRIDRALAFGKKQKEQTGKDLTYITSGGQGPDEVVSESAAMKNYLLDQGIPDCRIIQEDRSTSTMENMLYSREIIQRVDPEGKVAFATTNYHVFRSGLCARRVKMRAVGIGAETKWYFWPNASVREFVGLLTEHRGKQALVFGGLSAVYVILTWLVYR